MRTVADLVAGEAILRLAEPGDYDRGRALVEQGSVNLEAVTPIRVTATVQDPERHRVELRLTPRGLEWWCSCPPGRSGAFCAHVVATAFAVWRQTPGRPPRPA
ncbi:MAG TPA: SWIM zinc finger family protein [Candidatus Limnocylindrales bacterium]|nr:SWIM zinc finger family protein [Candidatus Limnocylindrales bacterium]